MDKLNTSILINVATSNSVYLNMAQTRSLYNHFQINLLKIYTFKLKYVAK